MMQREVDCACVLEDWTWIGGSRDGTVFRSEYGRQSGCSSERGGGAVLARGGICSGVRGRAGIKTEGRLPGLTKTFGTNGILYSLNDVVSFYTGPSSEGDEFQKTRGASMMNGGIRYCVSVTTPIGANFTYVTLSSAFFGISSVYGKACVLHGSF